MEDKEVKKKLRKVPDVDETGEPIWKIDRTAAKAEEKKRSKPPPSLRKNRDAA
jgi:hypothetical protein